MADDVYKSAVVGGLKLKGAKASGVKKKKKKKNKAEEIESHASTSTNSPKQSRKYEDDDAGEPQKNPKTPAEIAFEKSQQKRAAERIMKKASKTHKQRVEELNSYLDNLSEHYDIQKVSWTK